MNMRIKAGLVAGISAVLIVWIVAESLANPVRPSIAAPMPSQPVITVTTEKVLPATRGPLQSGYEGTVGKSTTFAAVDDAAWNAMHQTMTARDETGMLQLIMAGRVFMLAPGTRVLAIESGFTSTKVRALEGASAGKAGWVAYEMVGP